MGGKGSGGQNRKPNEQKRVLGNPGQGRLPETAEVIPLPSVSEVLSEPTRPLGRHGEREWNEVLSSDATLWIAPTDRSLLLLYCESIDEYLFWRGRSLTENDPDLAWRAAKRADDLRRSVFQLAAELGLSPLGRSRLGVAEVRMREGLARITGGRTSEESEF